MDEIEEFKDFHVARNRLAERMVFWANRVCDKSPDDEAAFYLDGPDALTRVDRRTIWELSIETDLTYYIEYPPGKRASVELFGGQAVAKWLASADDSGERLNVAASSDESAQKGRQCMPEQISALRRLDEALQHFLESGWSSEGSASSDPHAGMEPTDLGCDSVEPEGEIHNAVCELQEKFYGGMLPPPDALNLWRDLQKVCRHERDDYKRQNDAHSVAGKLQARAQAEIERIGNLGTKATDRENPRVDSIRRPPENAFKAWRLRDLTGITTQTEIAAKLIEQGVDATQGQVSRWMKQVEEYLAAGNVLPTITPLTAQPKSIDPKIIDMGERRDNRTPRQRERGDTEDR